MKYLQLFESFNISENLKYHMGVYHRVIKGTGNLKIKLKKL